MVFEKVRGIISEQLSIEEEKITLETSLTDDLKADSLDVVELIMDLEQEFDLEIPDDLLPNMKTVQDIVKYISDHQ